MVDPKDFDSDFENKWCPGCGNFSILAAMKNALAGLGLTPERLLIVSGIGQAAKTPHFLKCNTFHGLHGRALPVAVGAKTANHDLTVLVNSGDGDCYGEGGNHFIHTVRRNIDMTLLVHNNKVYGLTKGQASPTSDLGMITKIQQKGVLSESFNPIAVSLALGCTFVARGFSGDIDHTTELIKRAVRHKGFSLVDILQPCLSFNTVNTFGWYKERVYDFNKEHGIPETIGKAMDVALQWGDRIPIGIFHQREAAGFIDRLDTLKQGTLLSRPYDKKRLDQVFSDIWAIE